MQNLSLFPEPPQPIEPAPDRAEPSLWIRRIVIADGFGPQASTVNEVRFRRGLNIIKTAERSDNEPRPVGHSVGKTMLLRLIRYCLGEQAYCTKVVREAVADRYPHGYVLAEFCLLGEPWVVARPIGLESAGPAVAAQGSDFSMLWDAAQRPSRHSVFVDRIEEKIVEPLRHVTLTYAKRPSRWQDLLAWLARDQECRFIHHNEWRDPETESGTAKLAREDAGLLLRAVMDVFGTKEQDLRLRHAKLHAELAALVQKQQRQQAFLEQEQEGLREALEITVGVPDGEMLADQAVRLADDRQSSLRRLLEEHADSRIVAEAEEALRRATEVLLTTTVEINQMEAQKKVEEGNLQSIRNSDNDAYYTSCVPTNPWCRFFNDKDDASTAGCPGDVETRQPGARDPYHEARIREASEHIVSLERELAPKRAAIQEQQDMKDVALEALKKARNKYETEKQGIWTRIGYCDALAERARRYGLAWAAYRNLAPAQQAKQKKIEESLEEQAKTRLREKKKVAALSGHFDATLKALLGEHFGGKIVISAQGISPEPNTTAASTGAALSTSATVLGFDLACLVAGICGLGHHPLLLIHDSPREADMEVQMYHRLIHHIADIEAAFGDKEPSFQYIMTTTTQPPEDLDNDTYVRLILDARDNSRLLLKERL